MYQLHGIILFRIDCCHMVKAHVSVQWCCECSIENLVLDFLSLLQRFEAVVYSSVMSTSVNLLISCLLTSLKHM